jgi:16S rRNA (cytidine1402-2'-O)-methyltransferase
MEYEKPALFIVTTPIGNLEDITLRAIDVLKYVDVIACEDTRTTQKLLTRFDIKNRTVSLHKFNEKTKTDMIIEEILSGKNYAYVSQAGAPCISDPGYLIVKKAIEAGIVVYPIPGVTALITAMMAAGLPSEKFIFEGFLHYKKNRKKEQLLKAFDSGYTVIFYESPHRIISTIEMIHELNPDIEICLAREMTKIHEEFIRGSASDVLNRLNKKAKIKGEFTLLINSTLT